MQPPQNPLKVRQSADCKPYSRHLLGFTLIELLVVVAIIAILTVLLIPAIQDATRKSKQAVCLGNVRTMGNAVLAYVADEGNFGVTGGSGTVMYMQYLTNYIVNKTTTSSRGMPRCPNVKGVSTNASYNPGSYSVINYLLQNYPSLKGIPVPSSRCVLVIEDSYQGAGINYAAQITGTLWWLEWIYGSHPQVNGGGYKDLLPIEGLDYQAIYHGPSTNRGLNSFMADGSAILIRPTEGSFNRWPNKTTIKNGVPWSSATGTVETRANAQGYFYDADQFQAMRSGGNSYPYP